MQNLKKNGKNREKEITRFICIAIMTIILLGFFTNMKMKAFQCIFLCQWFDISHATDFQKAMSGDIKYSNTEVPFLYMYFTSV